MSVYVLSASRERFGAGRTILHEFPFSQENKEDRERRMGRSCRAYHHRHGRLFRTRSHSGCILGFPYDLKKNPGTTALRAGYGAGLVLFMRPTHEQLSKKPRGVCQLFRAQASFSSRASVSLAASSFGSRHPHTNSLLRLCASPICAD